MLIELADPLVLAVSDCLLYVVTDEMYSPSSYMLESNLEDWNISGELFQILWVDRIRDLKHDLA